MIKIIQVNGNIELKDILGTPADAVLKKWIGCEFLEIVRVFYEGKHEQLIIDEMGSLDKKTFNLTATDIYHENIRVHEPSLLLNANCIYGIAVLLTGANKLT